jgi:hypothetical protein
MMWGGVLVKWGEKLTDLRRWGIYTKNRNKITKYCSFLYEIPDQKVPTPELFNQAPEQKAPVTELRYNEGAYEVGRGTATVATVEVVILSIPIMN